MTEIEFKLKAEPEDCSYITSRSTEFHHNEEMLLTPSCSTHWKEARDNPGDERNGMDNL